MEATAKRASRSSHDPGKVTTPIRTRAPRLAVPAVRRLPDGPRFSGGLGLSPRIPGLPAEAVGPGGPGGHAPLVVGELAVADGGGGQAGVGVDPQEAAAGPEVAEGRRRAAVAHPVGALAVVELEAEAPVAGVEAADPGHQTGQAGELDFCGLGEQLRTDHRGAPVEQAAGQAGQVVEGRGGPGGRVAVDAVAVDEPGHRHAKGVEDAGGEPGGEAHPGGVGDRVGQQPEAEVGVDAALAGGAGPARGLEREPAGVGQQVPDGDPLAAPGGDGLGDRLVEVEAARGDRGQGGQRSRQLGHRRHLELVAAGHLAQERRLHPGRRDHRHRGPPNRPVQRQAHRYPASFSRPMAAASSSASRAAASAQPRFGWTPAPNRRPQASSSAFRASSSEAAVTSSDLRTRSSSAAAGGRASATWLPSWARTAATRSGAASPCWNLAWTRTSGGPVPNRVVDSLIDSWNSAKAITAPARWSPSRARWMGAVERRAHSLVAAASSRATSPAVPTRVTRSSRRQPARRRTSRSALSGRRMGTRTSPTPWLRPWAGGERRSATGSWSGTVRKLPTTVATSTTVETAAASHSHQGSRGQGRALRAAASSGLSRRGRPRDGSRGLRNRP